MAIRTGLGTGRRVKKRKMRRRSMEKRAVCALLIMAIAWVFGFFGVIIWHNNTLKHQAQPPAAAGPIGATTTQKQPAANSANSLSIINNQHVGKNDNNQKMLVSSSSASKSSSFESPLVIFTCQRAQYLTDTLTDIFNNIATPCRFGCPIIVSQDGTHNDVDQVIASFQEKFQAKGVPFYHIHHERGQILQNKSSNNNNNNNNNNLRGTTASVNAYTLLAQHYGWTLSQIFNGNIADAAADNLPPAQRVIILEEDIHTSPDFFTYFEATSKLLDDDPTLFAVSAFNDNGHMTGLDATRLLRSDFFPGLGWMMNRDLWKNELEAKWPLSYWDDWLREPEQRQNRQIIRPEYSRTYHFGKQGGASRNQFGSILERVQLSKDNTIDWTKEDLSVLGNDELYNQQYGQLILASTVVSSLGEAEGALKSGNARLEYRDFPKFKSYARKLFIMDDEKAMVPRTAYQGVVETRPIGTSNNNILFLTPPAKEMRESFPGVGFP